MAAFGTDWKSKVGPWLELLEELKDLSLDNALSLPQVCSALKISLLNIIDMRCW
jgi:hypothetical protein